MKRFISIVLAILISVTQLSIVSNAVFDETDNLSLHNFTGELVSLVKLGDEYNGNIVSEATIDEDAAGTTNRVIVKASEKLDPLDSVGYIYGYNDLHILQFTNKQSAEKAIDYYSSLSCVEYAEYDGILSEAIVEEEYVSEAATFNFPSKIQADRFGYTSAKSSMGSNSVTVAVVDSGVQNDHSFLYGRIEPTGFNSVTEGGTCYDDRGHGTQVAGIIVANTRSNVTVKPYKVLDKWGEGSVSQVVLGIEAAIQDGVDIINLSMTLQGYNETLYEAVLKAYNAGISVVVAAGNSSTDLDQVDYSPAGFPETISVFSCTSARKLSSFSNYGTPVDCGAPGEDVISTTIGNAYKKSSGTSLAAPFICAAVSYILSSTPGLSPDEVCTQLLSKSQPLYGTISGRVIYPGTTLTISGKATDPAYPFSQCSFSGELTIDITSTSSSSTILYSVNNGASYKEYTGPFNINSTTTVSAFCVESGKVDSNIVSISYNCYGDENTFVLDSNNNLIEYNGTEANVKVPQYVNGKVINSVKASTFSGNSFITSVIFDSVASLDSCLFKNCTALTTVTANTATSIGDECFSGCTSLTSATLPKVTDIPYKAFYGCSSLKSATFAAATAIGESAFENCENLTTFTAANVKSIGAGAFANSNISGISMNYLSSIGEDALLGCSNLKTFSNSALTQISENLFKDCTALQSIALNGITVLPTAMLKEMKNLTSITATKVKNIGAYAFANNSTLTNVSFSGATSVGEYAFYNCPLLKTASIGDATLSNSVFEDCTALSSLSSPNFTSVGSKAFKNCTSLSSIKLTNVQTLGDEALYNSGVTSLSLTSLTSFGINAFYNLSKVKTVNLPSVTDVDLESFTGCSAITSFKVNGATTISGNGLSVSQLFPALQSFYATAATNLANVSFEECASLKIVSLPNVLNIDLNIFKGSPNIMEFYFTNSENVDGIETVSTEFPNITTFKADKITAIPDNSFYNCENLKTVSFANTVSIGKNAFRNTPLTSLDFPKLSDVGSNAFSDMLNITSVSLSVSNIDMDVFSGSTNIKTFTLNSLKNVTNLNNMQEKFPALTTFSANSLQTIPENAFKNCVTLTAVSFINAETVEDSAFENTGITSILLDDVITVGNRAFANIKAKTISLNQAVNIGDDAFCGNENLVSVSLYEAKNVNIQWFTGCSNITTMSFGSVADIDEGYSVSENFPNLTTFTGTFDVVPQGMFENCVNLTSATITANEVGARAFKNCTGLTDFNINTRKMGEAALEGLPFTEYNFEYLSVFNSNIFGNDVDKIEALYLNNLNTVDSTTFSGLSNLSTIQLNSVKNIPDNCFENLVSLKQIDLTNVTEIGAQAFSGCISLETVCANNALTIGDRAFYGCKKLYDVTITNAVELGNEAFKNCGSITGFYADGLTSIEPYIIEENDLQYISLNSITEFPENISFADNYSIEVFNANSLTTVPTAFFKDCWNLSEVSLLNVNTIGDYAFYNAGTNVNPCNYDFGTNLVYIGDYAFYGSRVDSIKGSLLVFMGDYAFAESSLSAINAPKLETIPKGAFRNCNNLVRAYFDSANVVSNNAFNSSSIVYVKLGNLTQIGDYAFYECFNLGGFISSPDTAYDIGEYAFVNTSLNEKSFAELNPKSIGYMAFFDCSNSYTSVSFPNLETIDEFAFGDISIDAFYIENVKSIMSLPISDHIFIGSDAKFISLLDSNISQVAIYSENPTIKNYSEIQGIQCSPVSDGCYVLSDNYVLLSCGKDTAMFEVAGPTNEYTWYGFNNEDKSDAVAVAVGQNLSLDETLETNDFAKYKYFYCVSKSTFDGVEMTQESKVCDNLLALFRPLNTNNDIFFSGENFVSHFIVSDELHGGNIIGNFEIDPRANITYTPTYETVGQDIVLGTDSEIRVEYKGKTLYYYVILNGDINGDGFVDVLDTSSVAAQVNGLGELSGNFLSASDLNRDDVYDVLDYQAVVNKALA